LRASITDQRVNNSNSSSNSNNSLRPSSQCLLPNNFT